MPTDPQPAVTKKVQFPFDPAQHADQPALPVSPLITTAADFARWGAALTPRIDAVDAEALQHDARIAHALTAELAKLRVELEDARADLNSCISIQRNRAAFWKKQAEDREGWLKEREAVNARLAEQLAAAERRIRSLNGQLIDADVALILAKDQLPSDGSEVTP